MAACEGQHESARVIDVAEEAYLRCLMIGLVRIWVVVH